MSRLARHLRHNAVAYLALFVALSSTATAAVTLKKNSVLSRHIKNGQVKNSDLANNADTGSKVRDATLQAGDFAPNQLPAGPAGPAGPEGPRGPQGPEGPANPNADLLDNLDSTAFAQAGHNHDAAYVNEGQPDSVAGAMIEDTARLIHLPLGSFHNCGAVDGPLDYTSSSSDRTPDFAARASDGQGFGIVFDSDPSFQDELQEVCSQFVAPPDMDPTKEPLDVVVSVRHAGAAGASERVLCSAGNDGAAPPAPTARLLSGNASYFCDPFGAGNLPAALFPVTIALSVDAITSGGGAISINEPVEITSVAVRYQSRQ